MNDTETSFEELNSIDYIDQIDQIDQHAINDCMICLESVNIDITETYISDTPITNIIKIWTCPQCFKHFHQQCINEWKQSRPRKHFICPHCKFIIAKYKPTHISNNIHILANSPVVEHYIYGRIQNSIYGGVCIILCILIAFVALYVMNNTIFNHYHYHYNTTI